MTDQQKDLIWLLLQEDHYLVKTINSRGKEVYKVLEGRQIPVQYFTEADMAKMRNAGYDRPFYSLEDGVKEYVKDYLLTGKYY